MWRKLGLIFALFTTVIACQPSSDANTLMLARAGHGGHNGSITNASGTVATTLTPNSGTILNTDTGTIASITPSGGSPNSYTCALHAGALSGLAITSGCALSTSTTQSNGAYQVGIDVTNMSGTATLQFSLTVSSPPQIVAQAISPTSIQISNTATGVIDTFEPSGGFPATYTCNLAGTDQASFSMNSATCELSVPMAISMAGTKNITVSATNAAGTSSAFAVVVTVVSPASAVWATPTESDIPAGTHTITLDCNPSPCLTTGTAVANTGFIVTASDVAAIPVNQTYSRWGDVYSLATHGVGAAGSTRINMPSGVITSTTTQAGFSVNGTASAYIVCAHDGTGPLTTFRAIKTTGAADGSIDLFSMNSSDPNAQLWIMHCKGGPADSELATNIIFQSGDNFFRMQKGGTFKLIDSVVRNLLNTCMYGDIGNEWYDRAHAVFQEFDSEIYGCASASSDHNHYLHAYHEIDVIRTVCRDTRGSHCYKTDSDKLVMLDSYCLRDTGVTGPDGAGHTVALKGQGNHSACINGNSFAQDYRIARNYIDHTDVNNNAVSIIETISRANANGGWSTKLPPTDDIEADTGTVRSPNGPYAHWASASFIPSSATKSLNKVGKMNAASTGATSISLKNMASEAEANNVTLSTSTSYNVRVQLSDNTVYSFTGTPSAAASSTATFSSGVSVPSPGIAANAWVAVVPASNGAWDYRRPNPRFYNRAYTVGGVNHYFFGTGTFGIRNAGTGLLDLAKQANYPTLYFEDDMIFLNTPNNSMSIYQQDLRMPGAFNDNNNQGIGASIPPPPVNRPGGATSDWPDVANAGTYAEPLAGTGNPEYGRAPTGFVDGCTPGANSDFVWFNPAFFKNIGIYKAQGNFSRQFQQDDPTGQYNGCGDIRWLDSGGTLNKVDFNSAGHSPLPTAGNTTLNGAHTTGTQTLTVANGLVCSNGQRLMMQLPAIRGSANAIFISTIDQAPGATTLHTADMLPRNASSGAAIACFTKAGSDPANWVTPDNYSTQ